MFHWTLSGKYSADVVIVLSKFKINAVPHFIIIYLCSALRKAPLVGLHVGVVLVGLKGQPVNKVNSVVTLREELEKSIFVFVWHLSTS